MNEHCPLCDAPGHCAEDCHLYTEHDRAMMALGATLLVNLFIEGDYGQDALWSLESLLGTLSGAEDLDD